MKQLQILNRNQVKWIALLAMICDHFAVAFLEPATVAYQILRGPIGRISFPLFFVLFLEGLFYTKRPWWHVVDCLIWAFISEIPFDMALQKCNGYVEFEYQNVMFTWCLCGIFFCVLRFLFQMLDEVRNIWCIWLCNIGAYVIFYMLAVFLKVDYAEIAITGMFLMYCLRAYYKGIPTWILSLPIVLFDMLLSMMWYPAIAVVILLFYNRDVICKANVWLKYWFYGFYPLHLAVFAVVLRYFC